MLLALTVNDLVFRTHHDEHGTGRLAKHFARHTAKQCTPRSTRSLSPDDDQVASEARRGEEYLLSRLTECQLSGNCTEPSRLELIFPGLGGLPDFILYGCRISL